VSHHTWTFFEMSSQYVVQAGFKQTILLPQDHKWAKLDTEVLLVFSVVACAFDVMCKKSLPNPMAWSFSPVFFFLRVLVFSLMLSTLFHFNWLLCMVSSWFVLSLSILWISG
jgi:hypothetical protein